MSCNKEIGGYFGIECGHVPSYHKNGILLNSGRNALRHIVRTLQIREIYLPFYTCPVVHEAVRKENCKIVFYEINQDFIPVETFPPKAFIVYNNYWGVCGKQVQKMAAEYSNLIVDNAQSFYSDPRGRASFYSPRKFFGVPDGGIICSNDCVECGYPEDVSSDQRCSHLLTRPLRGAQAGYADFCKNDAAMENFDIMKMSSLTRAIMGNIDYQSIRECRLANFYTLHRLLEPEKQWNLAPDDVPMVYPYFTDDTELRDYLIKHKIFTAFYWPGIDSRCVTLRSRILSLPLDQRYGAEDMEYIVRVIKNKEKSLC